jgi:hypothetical protein
LWLCVSLKRWQKKRGDMFFLRIFMKIVFFLSVSSIYANNSSVPKEAWIAFATSNYFDLLEVTIASVHDFSTKPIIVVGVNADIPFSNEKYPNMIKKRVDADLNKFSIFYQKPRIILESGLEYGVYIEADDILNSGCDNLFNFAYEEREYPLCPLHPQDPNNQQQLMKILGVTSKSMPYVHGHVIFSYRSMPFIKEWYETSLKYANSAPNFDETVLNVLLWKHNITEQVYTYDPWQGRIVEYMQLTSDEAMNPPFCYWYMFHGCKNPKNAWEILQKLRDRNEGLN